MKVVILAGGKGTRLAEETDTTPKVLLEIGGRPILWHIIEHYAHSGYRDIFVALGHKGDLVRRHFAELFADTPCLSLDFASGTAAAEPLSVDGARLGARLHLVDTGPDTATGGRLFRLRRFLADAPFMVTYGDGLADVDLAALLELHRAHRRTATLTAVAPPSRFGRLICDGDMVARFEEKPGKKPAQAGTRALPPPSPSAWQEWINGGFFVFNPAIFEWLPGDATSLEEDVLPRLAAAGELAAYRHHGFWQCMDTLHDRRILQELWAAGRAPWRVWTD